MRRIQRPTFFQTYLWLLLAGLPTAISRADDPIILRNEVVQVSIAVEGGGLVEFRFLDQPWNPLNWDTRESAATAPPSPRGHFLCLDRWGAPSAAEAKHGMPFHGEASRAVWNVTQAPGRKDDGWSGEMECSLPMAGLQVRRILQLHAASSVLTVREQVTNVGQRGRIYNMVQHPTIAPPFLDDSTLVDANARYGFWQDGVIPSAPQSASQWPQMTIGSERTDLRRLLGAPGGETRHDVSSFVFDEAVEYGWVTACNPRKGLLIGYIWQTRDYPWLNIWRSIRDGKVAARGLEFGTTGYHQPFARLVEQHSILGQPLVAFLDAGQVVERSYAAFLCRVPDDFLGVGELEYQQHKLYVTERGEKQNKPRLLTIDAGHLFAS